MAKDCQYCGTSVFIPESGAIVLNPKDTKKEGKNLPLAISHESNDAQVYEYNSREELKSSLHVLFEGTTVLVAYHKQRTIPFLSYIYSASF